jgi:hypothetical protein
VLFQLPELLNNEDDAEFQPPEKLFRVELADIKLADEPRTLLYVLFQFPVLALTTVCVLFHPAVDALRTDCVSLYPRDAPNKEE